MSAKKKLKSVLVGLAYGALVQAVVVPQALAHPEEEPQLTASGAALDVHTHIMSQALLDGLTGGGPKSAGADDLIAKLDAGHVKKAVVLALGYWELPDDRNMAAENTFAASEIAKYPDRLIGFCGINPMYDSALAEIDRCLALPGMVGVKLQGSKYDWEDETQVQAVMAVLKKAGEKNAPVMLHVAGPPVLDKGMKNIFRTLAANGSTRIMLAHMGGLLDWELEAYIIGQSTSPKIIDGTNLFVDVSATLKRYQDAPLSKRETIVWRLRKFGIGKVHMGSDYIYVAPQQTPAEAVDTLTHFPFTQEEVDMILSNNGSAWLYGN